MIYQLFNLSNKRIFEGFSSSYKIYREIFENGLFGLEVRNISSDTAEEIYKIILEENEICYKRVTETGTNDLLIPGYLNELKELSKRVIASGKEDVGYKLQKTVSNYQDYNAIKYPLGGKEFQFNKTYIMGILNVTPDSFSDGGKYLNKDDAVSHALSMLDEGADIIDIGGESTRPGSEPVSEDEELKRVIPVISRILAERPDAIISVDTNKSGVASAALKEGAKIINDISGLTFDPVLADVVSEFNGTLIIMHIKGEPKTMQQDPYYENIISEVFDFLYKQTSIAAKTGIKNIIIDPGIGFGKTAEHNFELLKRLEDFKCLGYPIMIGVSRKSFIGKLLGLETNVRDVATAILETGAVLNGARILRTHNVQYCRYASKITEQFS